MKKFFSILKKKVLGLLIIGLIFNGFSKYGARLWKRHALKDLKENKDYSFKKKIWAYRHGSRPAYIDHFNVSKDNHKDHLMEKDYLYTYSINGIYNKWLADRVTFKNILIPFQDYIPKCFYQFYERDSQLKIIKLADCSDNYQDIWEDVFKLIKEENKVLLRTSRYASRFKAIISYSKDENAYYVECVRVTEEEIIDFIKNMHRTLVLTEYVEENMEFYVNDKEIKKIQLTIINEKGDNARISEAFLYTYARAHKMTMYNKFSKDIIAAEEQGEFSEDDFNETSRENIKIISKIDVATGEYRHGKAYINGIINTYETSPFTDKEIIGVIKNWNQIKEKVNDIFCFIPQIEFCAINIIITKTSFKISKVINLPRYPLEFGFNDSTNNYLRIKLYQKKELFKKYSAGLKYGFKKIKLKIRSIFTRCIYPKGMIFYLGVTWPKDIYKDFFSNKMTSVRRKIWAYRRGFLSYRIEQYTITQENHKQFISDFEYKWLRHINNKYRIWLEDKITIKYILSGFNEFLPEYYFYISYKNGNSKIIKMQDSPQYLSPTYESIFELLKKKGELAFKRDNGSHGDGFFRLSYRDNKIYLNLLETTEKNIIDILENKEHQYLITEYIQMHSQLKQIYDGAVNTIRIIVFKKDGKNPIIGNAYMRIGSKNTGVVDNMEAGGMYAQIDLYTGRYFNGKIMKDGNIVSCEYHPDTKIKIEGILPNWQRTKELVLEISRSLLQLEYLGFDIAITQNGIKIIEINRFVDYPKIEKWSPEITEYLLYKLNIKKAKYGYDKTRGYKLKKLPKR